MVVCVERGEGGPFIVLIDRFSSEIRAGTLITAFYRIRTIFPSKMSLNRLSRGSADPWVRPYPD